MSYIRAYIGRRLFSGWLKARVARQLRREGAVPLVAARLLNRMTMMVPPTDFVGKRVLWEGAYEYETVHMIDCLATQLGRTEVLLDVGANLGSHSLFLADVFRLVHAFEPDPTALAILRRNVELNRRATIRVHGYGLSSRDGELDFVSELGTAGNLGSSAFVFPAGDAATAARAVKRPVRTGDGVVSEQGIARVDAVKIDVEGHEIDVLMGLQRTLRRDRPLVVFEFQPRLLAARGGVEALKRCLEGYDLYVPSRSSRMRGHARLLRAWVCGPRFVLERTIELTRAERAVFAIPRGALAGDADRIDLSWGLKACGR